MDNNNSFQPFFTGGQAQFFGAPSSFQPFFTGGQAQFFGGPSSEINKPVSNIDQSDIDNILESVRTDNEAKFVEEIKKLSSLDDIDQIISNINESDIEDQYKIKYIFILILDKLIKEKNYLSFRENYFILREVGDYDIIKFREYLSSQAIINKILDILDVEEILDILKEYRNEDNIYIDSLLGDITIDYLKNNKKRLSSVLEEFIQNKDKNIFYFLEILFSNFEFEFVRDFLKSNQFIQLTLDEYYTITKKYLIEYFTQEESNILRNLLKTKIYTKRPINRDDVLQDKNYHDEYRNKYCKKFSKDGDVVQDELKPLIVTNTEISIPYKKILKFNKNTLYEFPKQTAHTLRFSHQYDNIIGGNKNLYNIEQEVYIDMNWYVNNIRYMENLPIKDKMTIMGYTHMGDRYANIYLMGNKENLTSYLTNTLGYQEINFFFPLYYQAKEKIVREKDSILKYIVGNKEKVIKDFITPITSNIEEITSYNLIVKNKQSLSLEFWFDVIKIFIDDLDRIIRQSPPTQTKMILFRGAASKYYKTDSNKYVNNTFMSTSLDYKVPLQFTEMDCCLKKIIINPGTHILFTECLTQHPGESEILIGLNNKFKIIEDKTKYYYNIYNYNQNEEYPDNLCIENENTMEVTVMETVN